MFSLVFYILREGFCPHFSCFIKDVGRLAINSRKAKLATQKPISKLVMDLILQSSKTCKIHVPIGAAEKNNVSPRNINPYFLSTSLNRVIKPKRKVKISDTRNIVPIPYEDQ